jgi:hypothetical protein
MSVLQKLTEGVQHRDMQAEGAALLNKWEATGLLEGLNQGQAKQGMAVLLENQAKELLREASSMAAGDVEGFAAVAFPIVRRVFGGLIANDLVSVQPMSLPSGLIFFLDFTHEASGESLYGGRKVGREILDGIEVDGGFYNLDANNQSGAKITTGTAGSLTDAVAARLAATALDATNEDFDPDLNGKDRVVVTNLPISGDRATQLDPGAASAIRLHMRAHNIGTVDAGISRTVDLKDGTQAMIFIASATTVEGQAQVVLDHLVAIRVKPVRRLAKFTTQNSSVDGLKRATAVARYVYEAVSSTDFCQTIDLDALISSFPGASGQTQADLDAISEKTLRDQVQAVIDNTTPPVAYATGRQAPTSRTAANLEAALDGGAATSAVVEGPSRDQLGTGTGLGAIAGADVWALEEPTPGTGNSGSASNKQAIAEIDIKVDSVAVTAQTKKLKAKWSPELGQDLNAYHNLDAEVELTGILSEQIALEIDRELLGELVRGATAGTRYWSRAPGLFVNSEGVEQGASSAAPDFTGTVSEWYETLIETINDVSAQIHRKTLRGGANFVVCSPEVANILEFTSGFRASVTADQDRGTIGAVKAGSLSKKFDVYVDPYFIRNVLLVGRKGSSFLESGYVYAPYVPLQVTPTIFGTEDFVPRKGVMTRYAKKMVRPDMYGLVIVRGLLGESGATAA